MHSPDAGPRSVAWQVGDVIDGRYEVTGTVGRRATGTVHQVRHLLWKTDLAVTTPPPGTWTDRAARARFLREAEAWARLDPHPHVCTCHYARVFDGVPRVFTELTGGGTLRERVDDGSLHRGDPGEAVPRVLELAVQLAEGLAHVHAQGFVHQDVRPDAVLLAAGDGGGPETVKLAGFVTAPVISASPGPSAYASPERAAGNRAGALGDIWSFAVTVQEMFTGSVSRGGARGGGHDGGHGGVGGPRVPEAVAGLLDRCLREAPGERPGTMAEIVEELTAIHARLTGRPRPRSVPDPAGSRADGLNDRALALLDLGDDDAATAALDQALAIDPRHPSATYHAGLLRWRRGEATDEAVIAALEAVADAGPSWKVPCLLAQVHLERGDVAAARAHLEGMARDPRDRYPGAGAPGSAGPGDDPGRGPGDDPETASLLRRVTAGEVTDACCLVTHTVPWNPWSGSRISDRCGSPHPVAIRLDPTGRTALTGDADGRVRLWEPRTGRCLQELTGHHAGVRTLDLTPDGSHAVSSGSDNTVRWWDLERGVCVRVVDVEPVTPHGIAVASVCLTADGTGVLAAGQDGTVRLFPGDGATDGLVLTGHTGGVNVVAAGPRPGQGTGTGTALSGGWDHDVRAWDLDDGRCRHVFTGHHHPVTAAALAPAGPLGVTGDFGGAILVWHTEEGTGVAALGGHTGHVTAVALDGAGEFALSASTDGTVRYWETATGRCVRTFRGHRVMVSDVRFADDGRTALSADQDGSVRRWRLPGRYTAPPRLGRPRTRRDEDSRRAHAGALAAKAADALADHRPGAALTLLGEARALPGRARDPWLLRAWWGIAPSCLRRGVRAIWHVRTLTGHAAYVTSVDVTTDLATAVSGGADREVRIWDTADGTCRHVLTGHTDTVTSVCASADGLRAVSAGQDGAVRVWSTESGECLHLLTPRSPSSRRHGATCVRTSGDGRFVLTGYADGSVLLWDLDTGAVLRLAGHTSDVRTGWLAGDASLAVTGGYDRTIRVWDTADGTCRHVLTDHPGTVMSLGVTDDGRTAVSTGGSRDRTIRVWDLVGGCLRRVVDGGPGIPGAVRPLPAAGDGSLGAGGFAVTSGSPTGLRVHDLSTGERLDAPAGHAPGTLTVAATPDGRYVFTGGADHAVRLWELDWELARPGGLPGPAR
ncbi:MAG: hypothetical protein QG622_1426 [Actinomycetota bacterium]|nr:hypothetical protein [Actinomycetota bacterium]